MPLPTVASALRVPVLDSTMSYRQQGPEDAPVVLFLHGNPTSSYIWRNIMPAVADTHRAIAPDLIGYGHSGKPDIDYRFADHVRYLDGFIEALGLGTFYLVAQDWGTALAFHFAARFPQRVKGLAFMEFIRPFDRWDEFHQNPQARATFQKFRTPGIGEEMIQRDNLFLERVLPGSVRRTLSSEELATYKQPFPTEESRKPIWRLANELPIEGQPQDVHQCLTEAHAALEASTYPKLLFVGDPGAIVSPAFARQFAAGQRNIGVVELGAGFHYLQEDHAARIGETLRAWIATIEDDSRRGELPVAGAHVRMPSIQAVPGNAAEPSVDVVSD
jgi:haloalkane dehalogenase